MRIFVIASASMLLALPISAQVYQCRESSGKLAFSDQPCDKTQSSTLIQRKKSDEEIYRERMEASHANERKQQKHVNEMQQRQMESQQRMLEQQSARPAAATEQLGSSYQCKEARKELEFASSIRTISQNEKRNRTNAAIANVNASCGTNTPLMQEPQNVIIDPTALDSGNTHSRTQN